MNRNLGLCYTICWKFRASQINPFSYHYTLNKPLKNRKKVIINFRESRIENYHSNTKASLFYGNITIGIISGEWGSIIMLAGPTSPTYRGSTVYIYIKKERNRVLIVKIEQLKLLVRVETGYFVLKICEF